ncbi:MAG: hypothetical protein ACREHF_01985 [Rhizomicrobium sp.]
MSNIANPGATGLGITTKIFHERSGGRRIRNLADTGEVFALAAGVAAGNTRRATMLSLDECRAIAQLAAGAGVILHLAIELVAASDDGAAPEDVRARLEALCNATRALVEREPAANRPAPKEQN